MSRLNMITDAKNADVQVHGARNFHVRPTHEAYNRKRRFTDVDDNSKKKPAKRILLGNVRGSSTDLDRVRVKTLEEIRAGRAKKLPEQQISVTSSNDFRPIDVDATDGECEVTSTSRSETDGRKCGDAKLQRVVLVRPRDHVAEGAEKTSISTETTSANNERNDVDVTVSEFEEEHLLLSPRNGSARTDEESRRFDDVLLLDDGDDDDEFVLGNDATLHTEDLLKNIDELLND